MPTFIDESGDTGPVANGGTDYFHLGAVWMPSNAEVVQFHVDIQRLRRSLGLSADEEFKFSKTHREPRKRKAFFGLALRHEFRFAVSSIDKRTSDWRHTNGSHLHRACATELAALLRPTYYLAEHVRLPLREPIIVDNNQDRDFLAIVKEQFRALNSRRRPGSSMTGKIRFRGSEVSDMIQLIDMICGSVATLIEDRDATWYSLIADRDLDRPRLL